MPGIRYPSMINGMPVVTAPAEIDAITAQKLRLVLLEAAANGHATIMVDLTGTRSCDSSALSVLAAAHTRALDEGGELLLVLPDGGPATRVLDLTTLNRFFPCFTSLDRALAAQRPGRPRRPMLKMSVTASESGPVIILAGEADLTTAGQLSALVTGQLADGTPHLTIDVSRLRFADSQAIQTLALAAKTLNQRGGALVLLDPQQVVARALALMGVDRMITIRTKPHTMPGPQASEAGDP